MQFNFSICSLLIEASPLELPIFYNFLKEAGGPGGAHLAPWRNSTPSMSLSDVSSKKGINGQMSATLWQKK